MAKQALFEITVSGRSERTCGVNVVFERLDDETAGDRWAGEIALDLESLARLRHDRRAYGAALTAALFATQNVKDLFTAAKKELATIDSVRFRLHVGSANSALHNVLWETLVDPTDAAQWLLTNERLAFSRYVVPERRAFGIPPAPGSLRVLVVVGNPRQLAETEYFDPAARALDVKRRLAPIDVDAEVGRVRTALGGHGAIELLATDAENPTATSVRRIVEKLHNDFDVLYIVCHGALRRVDPQSPAEPLLYLGSEDGDSAAVLGTTLISAMRDLPSLPRLVVLVSCHSAGDGGPVVDDGGAFTALAPSLARIGVPAVVGMQGAVTMQTMAEFMPRFFAELAKDGQIDRALAAARAFVQKAADAWMPTLYLQSRDGRLWAPAGAQATLSGFQEWTKLIEVIKAGDCTVVIGSGLFDSTFVPQAAIASRWMKEEGLPLVEGGPEDLAHVAQYVATKSGEDGLRARWRETLITELRGRYGAALERENPDISYDDLDGLLSAVGSLRADGVGTPYQVLAELPFKIFVVTTPDNVMADALRKAKKNPVVEVFRWKESLGGLPTITETDRAYRPSERRPLVYHLLGHVKYPASVVLSEDHYLEWLTRINNPAVHTITAVETSLKEYSLLLLGFQFADWDFRVLFRAIAPGSRSKLRGVPGTPPSVAVQLDPDDRFLQPKLVQRYIEQYFGIANLSIAWGSPDRFARELSRKWQLAKEGHRV
jgi:hypothetical protein